MDSRERAAKGRRKRNKPLSTPRIRTNNHTLPHITQILPNPPQRAGLRIQIVDRHIEEPLYLASMQIHCDNMVAPRRLQHIRNQLRGDGRPGLVFLVLARVGEVRDHGCDAAGGRSLAGVDHDEEFHEAVVDVAWGGGL